jgi:fructose-bisphosphate aldolase, class I
MNEQGLESTAKAMVAPGKGILAMDESTPTCKKRFEALGIECTEENRRTYRELLVTTKGLSQFISGAILFDETIRQKLSNGTPFPGYMDEVGIIPGIKVDTGAKDLAGFPGEKVTEGLDRLRERLAEYVGMGARFTKWRAVITIGNDIPSQGCIDANAHALARYAALAQEAGMVPIVEPEVLIDGSHTIAECYDATHATLGAVFRELAGQRVHLPGMVLKASMVISGLKCSKRAGVSEVAEHTVRCLLDTVPATAHLNAMHNLGKDLPWPLTFSYARALQQRAMEIWRGDAANIAAAQAALHHRAKLNGAASLGNYDEGMEKQAA